MTELNYWHMMSSPVNDPKLTIFQPYQMDTIQQNTTWTKAENRKWKGERNYRA